MGVSHVLLRFELNSQHYYCKTMMKVVLVGAAITTVIAFAGVIATWSVIYSTDIGSEVDTNSTTTTVVPTTTTAANGVTTTTGNSPTTTAANGVTTTTGNGPTTTTTTITTTSTPTAAPCVNGGVCAVDADCCNGSGEA